ncbi:MAG TPA: DoxX family protein [Candidatus Eisenbacteria bacterium]|nr:DoxX family protein [Candidatus Eisenbacteria bacterium]
MNIVLWIIQILLGITFLGSGITKLARPRLALVGRLPYVADFSDSQVKGIGTLELLAAVGLIVPPVLHIATFLTPLAAVGLILLMGGAIATHVRRREPQMVAVNLVLLVLAAVVAIARFGPYPF